MAESRERELAQATRAELAAITPPRTCCREAERHGLGAAAHGHARSPVIARLAVRLAESAPGEGSEPPVFDWAGARDHCRASWLRGRFLSTGSLYTSVLPSLLVPGIRAALENARGLRVYVANVAPQLGETEGYTLSEHVAALTAHDVGHLIDVVLANDDTSARVPAGYPAEPVRIDLPRGGDGWPRLELAAVVDPDNAHSHDPQRLTQALLRLVDEKPAMRPVAPIRSA